MADDAVIKLGYDNSKVRAGAKETEQTMQRTAQTIKTKWGEIGEGMSGIIGKVGVGLAVGMAAKAVRGLLSDFDDISDSAARLGVGAESFQRIKLQAELAGGSVDGLSTALLKMESAMQRGGEEGDKIAAALQGLRISADEFSNASPEQRVAMLATAFQKARSEGRGLAEIQDLFKKQFTELIPLLSTSADEMARIAGEKVVSNEDVATLARANDQLEMIGNRVKVFAATNLSKLVSEFDQITAAYARFKANRADGTDQGAFATGELTQAWMNDFRHFTGGGGEKKFKGVIGDKILGPQIAPIEGPREGSKQEKEAVIAIAKAQKELDAARRSAAMEQASAQGKLNMLINERATIEQRFKAVDGDKLESLRLQTEYQKLALEIARQQKEVADETNKAEATKLQQVEDYYDTLNAYRQRMDSHRKKAADEEEKEQKRKEKASEMLTNVQEMSARAKGHNRKADQIARAGRVEKRANEIVEQLGVSPEDANNIAEQEEKLQNKIDGKSNTRGVAGQKRDNDLFIQKINGGGAKNGAKTLPRDPTQDDSRRLLERIAAGIEQLTAE